MQRHAYAVDRSQAHAWPKLYGMPGYRMQAETLRDHSEADLQLQQCQVHADALPLPATEGKVGEAGAA
jgi:hypothetical protein